MHDNPFLRPDAAGYAAIFADGSLHVLGQRGLDTWSVGAIARWMKVRPPTVLKSYSRARVIEMTVGAYADRWLQWSSRPRYDSDLPAALPGTDAERHGLRVWHLLAELARGETLAGRPGPEEICAVAHRKEFHLMSARMGQLLERAATRDELLTMSALITGLRVMLVQCQPLVEVEEAEHLVAELVGLIRSRASPT